MVVPGIFLVSKLPVGAITNASYGLIGSFNPLVRSQVLIVFATGLGAVRASGNLPVTVTPVTVLVDGVEFPVQFAGLAPGIPGYIQVNVQIPGGGAHHPV